MFSVRSSLTRRHILAGYLPLFAALSLSLLLFLVIILFLARYEFMEYCSNDVADRLEKYLHHRSSGVVISTVADSSLQGLSFIRLIHENEQYLYSAGSGKDVDFEGIVNLDPRRSAVWISLSGQNTNQYWAVRSKELNSGFMVQAGKEYPEIVALYGKLRNTIQILAVLAFLLSGGATLLCRRKSTASLREAEYLLQRIITGNGGEQFGDIFNPELERLFHQLKRLISQNRQLVKEMQESLDNVAHDLRTPMTRLRSVAEYGLQQNSRDKVAEALSDCLEESERVLSMLGIMMSVAEAESGTMRLNREAVELSVSLSDAAGLYEYVAEEKNIALQLELVPGIMVDCDRTRLTQVWANIIDNGIKYGRRGGYVRIEMRPDQKGVSVIFEDNGIGISANEIERIWERLFRGDRSRSEQGLGLGLNYVRAVIEAHGGEISAASRLGEGARFEVRLPRCQDEL